MCNHRYPIWSNMLSSVIIFSFSGTDISHALVWLYKHDGSRDDWQHNVHTWHWLMVFGISFLCSSFRWDTSHNLINLKMEFACPVSCMHPLNKQRMSRKMLLSTSQVPFHRHAAIIIFHCCHSQNPPFHHHYRHGTS